MGDATNPVVSGRATWPEADPVVAQEVEQGMMPADQFPDFWEWMGRLDKLRDQLLAC